MAKQIIILDSGTGPGGDVNVRFAFWLVPPTANQVKKPGATSAYLGASAAEAISIQSGQTIEEVYSAQYTVAFTLAQIEANLQTKYAVRQAAITAAINAVQWYGSFWDGATWTGKSEQLSASASFGQGSRIVTGFNLSLTIGDNTVLAAVSGQRYMLDRLLLAVSGSTVLQFKDGASLMLGSTPMSTVPLTLGADPTGEPWFATSPGNAFIINSTAAITLGGRVWYRQA